MADTSDDQASQAEGEQPPVLQDDDLLEPSFHSLACVQSLECKDQAARHPELAGGWDLRKPINIAHELQRDKIRR